MMLWRPLALLLLLGPACATRVGNPGKPGAVTVPLVEQIVPATAAPADDADGEFAGADDFVSTLASSSPRHREIIAGLNATSEMVNDMELVLDEAKTVMVGDLEVKAIVRGGEGEEAEGTRHVVLCTAGKAFFAARWVDGASDVAGVADLASDPLGAFAAIAEKDRRFLASWSYAKTEARAELDMTLDGAPAENDPFVGELARVLDRSRFRREAGADAVSLQELQLWYDEALPSDLTPQVAVAGIIAADGAYEYAAHHVEAKLICAEPLDREKPEKPGWCFAYEASADGKTAAFKDGEVAQTVWAKVPSKDLIDPRTSAAPRFSDECPE
jgi:hypothetical protein